MDGGGHRMIPSHGEGESRPADYLWNSDDVNTNNAQREVIQRIRLKSIGIARVHETRRSNGNAQWREEKQHSRWLAQDVVLQK